MFSSSVCVRIFPTQQKGVDSARNSSQLHSSSLGRYFIFHVTACYSVTKIYHEIVKIFFLQLPVYILSFILSTEIPLHVFMLFILCLQSLQVLLTLQVFSKLCGFQVEFSLKCSATYVKKPAKYTFFSWIIYFSIFFYVR